MSKSILLPAKQWVRLRERLQNDYPPSVTLVRSKMREVLGFVTREHKFWVDGRGYQYNIHLDFYNEPKRTLFLLKYSDYLDKSGNTELDIQVI